MRTDDLIATLSAEAGYRPPLGRRVWTIAVPLSILAAGCVFFASLGVRPDIAAAAETVRFLFKFVVTGLLAACAVALVARLARPGAPLLAASTALGLAPLLLFGAVVLELWAVPQEAWVARAVGSNSMVCLTHVPLIGALPLAFLLIALRSQAPTRPGLAGAAAGLAAGGIAATFYAAQCTDDSPLFLALWYPLAIMVLTGAGYAAGRLLLRW